MVALRYNECNWLFQGHKGGKGDLGPKGYRVSFIVKIKGLIVRFFCKKLQPNLSKSIKSFFARIDSYLL